MRYLVYDNEYSFSYQKLKEQHEMFCNLSDQEFIAVLPKAIHFACFVSYLKELTPLETISDEGIIHQLVHILSIDDPITDLKEIRELFKVKLKLD